MSHMVAVIIVPYDSESGTGTGQHAAHKNGVEPIHKSIFGKKFVDFIE